MENHDSPDRSACGAVLFANGRMSFPFAVGGDGYLIHNLLRRLGARGYDVLHLGPLQPFHWPTSLEEMGAAFERHGLSLETDYEWAELGSSGWFPRHRDIRYRWPEYGCRLADADLFWQELESMLSSRWPRAVFTQLDGAEQVIERCRSHRIPVILWIVDVDPDNDVILAGDRQPDAVIFDSEFLAETYGESCKAPFHVVRPILQYPDRPEGGNGRCVAMVNPTIEKGGEIFFDIVRELPEIQFRVLASHRRPESIPPAANLTVLEAPADFETLMNGSAMLLVPSIVDDAFPTVIPLAVSHGVLPIGSRRGGIPEALGDDDRLLIDDPHDISAWVDCIVGFHSDDELRRQVAEEQRDALSALDPGGLMDRAAQILEGVASPAQAQADAGSPSPSIDSEARAIEIRPAEAGDVEQISGIVEAFEPGHLPFVLPHVEESISDPDSKEGAFFVASSGGVVVGSCGYTKDSMGRPDVFWVGGLYVAEPYRRQGVGAALMEEVEKHLRALGARKLYADVGAEEAQSAAIAAYQRYGFRFEGRLKDFFAEGDDFNILAKRL